MKSHSSNQRSSTAASRAHALPSLHIVASLYCFSLGVLALVIALNRV